MRVLENLEPNKVFYYFEEISKIPRPSYHEEAISNYLIQFAEAHHLEYIQDDLFNVIIFKDATPGYEDMDPIILQGHMDMVCEKRADVKKDMFTEGLDLEVLDGYVWAKGTTLGGDDGIAVAYALALLDSDTIQHPKLEFVCTIGEEVGMDGAHFIDLSCLDGHTLINLDSDDEGVVLAGCSGGGKAHVSLPVVRQACDWPMVKVSITGLLGGHSGAEIHKGRASSQELMGRILRRGYYTTPLRIVSCENGSKDNAISREGHLLVAVEKPEAFKAVVHILEKEIHEEYADIDPDIHFVAEDASNELLPLDQLSTCKVISLLTALPQGVQKMSKDIEGLVETSLNWGVASLHEDHFEMVSALRSSVSASYDQLVQKIYWIVQSYGATIEMKGEYPAWQWVKNSTLRDKMRTIYKEMYGEDLTITAIHAGVECGLFADKIDGMDAISMGPDIIDIHTPNEHMSIASVKKIWDFLVRVIETK